MAEPLRRLAHREPGQDRLLAFPGRGRPYPTVLSHGDRLFLFRRSSWGRRSRSYRHNEVLTTDAPSSQPAHDQRFSFPSFSARSRSAQIESVAIDRERALKTARGVLADEALQIDRCLRGPKRPVEHPSLNDGWLRAYADEHAAFAKFWRPMRK